MVRRLSINVRDLGLIPGSGRFPGEGNGNPLQYSCLENPRDGGAWCRLLSMGSQSQTRLSDFTSLLFSTLSEGRVSRLMWVTALSSFGKLVIWVLKWLDGIVTKERGILDRISWFSSYFCYQVQALSVSHTIDRPINWETSRWNRNKSFSWKASTPRR